MRHLVDEVGVTALDGPCQRLRFLAELQQQRDLRASRRYKRRTKMFHIESEKIQQNVTQVN